MSAKKNQPMLYSPVGVAVFPNLNKPDEKFNKWNVKLKLPKAEAEEFLSQFQEMLDEGFKKTLSDTKGKTDNKGKPIKPDNTGLPYQIEMDKDTKEPTGFYLIPFSANTSFKDQKTKEVRPISITLLDSQKQPTKAYVTGGSQIRVAFKPKYYYMDATQKAGLSLTLYAVQILELAQRGGDFAFDSVEGGFVSKGEVAPEEASVTEETQDVQASSTGDF